MRYYVVFIFCVFFSFYSCEEKTSHARNVFLKAVNNREFKGDSVAIYQEEFKKLFHNDTSLLCKSINLCFDAFKLEQDGNIDSSLLIISEVIDRNVLGSHLQEKIFTVRFELTLNNRDIPINWSHFNENVVEFNNEFSTLSSQVTTLLIQGIFNYRKSNLEKSKKKFLCADSLLRSSFPKHRIKTLYWLGQVERLSQNMEQSLQYYKKALEIAQRNNYFIYENKIKYAFGCFYHAINHEEKAKIAYKECIEGTKAINQKIVKLRAMDGLAISLFFQDSVSQAHEAFIQSLKIRKSEQDPKSLSIGLINLGAFHSHGHNTNIDSAQYYLEEAMNIRLKHKLGGSNLLRTLNELGNVYLKQGKQNEALSLYQKLMAEVDSVSDPKVYVTAQRQIAKIHQEYGNYEKAAKEYEAYIIANNEISMLQNKAKIAQVLAELDSSKKDVTIDTLESEISEYQYRSYIFYIPLLVIGVLSSIYLIFSHKKEILRVRDEEREKLEKEHSRVEQNAMKREMATTGNSDLPDYVKRFIYEIERNKIYFDPELSVAKIASIICSNSTYTSQACKTAYDCTIPELLNRKRIEESKRLLVQNGRRLSVSQIRNKVGYSSETQFYKNFRESTGITPNQYRKQVETFHNETVSSENKGY